MAPAQMFASATNVGYELAVQIPRSCFFLASKSSLVMMP
jgi:hypothetical protein